MATAAVEEGPEGFERRSFECSGCGHSEQNVIACDPMNTNAVGWVTAESRRPGQGFQQDKQPSLETTPELPLNLRESARPKSGDSR